MSVGRRMMMGAAGYLSEITTALFPGSSVATDNGTSGSWTFSPSNPNNVIDGSESTYAQFTGLTTSVTTSGGLLITFPAISAREILAVRFRCKGQGGSSGLSHSCTWTTAADSTSKPAGTHSVNFSAGGALVTVDSGLVSTDYAATPSGANMNFDASSLVGTSSAVLNYWAGGVRINISMSDYNGGGTGGKNYGPLLQVTYKPG